MVIVPLKYNRSILYDFSNALCLKSKKPPSNLANGQMDLSDFFPQQRTNPRTPTRKRSLEAHSASPRSDYQIYCLPRLPSLKRNLTLVKEDNKVSEPHRWPYQNDLLDHKDSPHLIKDQTNPTQKRQHQKHHLLTHFLLSLLLLSTLYCVIIPFPQQYTKKYSLQENFERSTIPQSDKLESKKIIGICGWLQFSMNYK